MTLAAGKLVRVTRCILRAQSDFVQQRGHATVGRTALGESVHDQTFLDRGAHRHARIERAVRILKDDLHASPHAAQRFATQRQHIGAVKAHRTGDCASDALEQPRANGKMLGEVAHLE